MTTPSTETSPETSSAGPPTDVAVVESIARGTVKWYSVAKGYGFIETPDEDRDVFVHHSQLPTPEDLFEGDRVRFEMVEGPKGLQARGVKVVAD